MFSSLEPEAAARLAERAELLTADPGAVICDQHEPADALFLVRSGTVNVVNNASALIDVREIADWKGLCSALLAGEQAMGTSSAP
jgi:signal-transduction protein with cAMP-binding, CBS, and nucleotidyltransferase domain